MSAMNWLLDDKVYRYIFDTFVQEHPVLAKLRILTQQQPMAGMEIPPEQGQWLQWLIKLMGAKRILEIGTFTGYSALAMALALPEDGQLITCDINEESTAVAPPFWREAGVAHKIDLRLAPAAETLQQFLEQQGANSFDLAFIDGDKANYPAYYDLCYELVRAGGVLVLDNMLWHGRVVDPAVADTRTMVLRQLNLRIAGDVRVERCLLAVGDGVLMVRKK
jgi:predicted O-methyltransferase YrrM